MLTSDLTLKYIHVYPHSQVHTLREHLSPHTAYRDGGVASEGDAGTPKGMRARTQCSQDGRARLCCSALGPIAVWQ